MVIIHELRGTVKQIRSNIYQFYPEACINQDFGLITLLGKIHASEEPNLVNLELSVGGPENQRFVAFELTQVRGTYRKVHELNTPTIISNLEPGEYRFKFLLDSYS